MKKLLFKSERRTNPEKETQIMDLSEKKKNSLFFCSFSIFPPKRKEKFFLLGRKNKTEKRVRRKWKPSSDLSPHMGKKHEVYIGKAWSLLKRACFYNIYGSTRLDKNVRAKKFFNQYLLRISDRFKNTIIISTAKVAVH